ncbi:homoserine dehydrogenase [Deinococcus maricopensis]|uniref:Homoserine dehydrogenase n=1 Tax=Deinococcus maricopensis (strain DSM 21211 / LMG 22137 / NRRL B-23946 / LB-34) TaxID=709986 RepID=E8U7S0_DEIML|nr:homoserine dehydrogenase [Deinococcus maricopensis]ADV67109.1 Homoserine dehydrogenase [Deinococcus maricopensis DSM 21211]
MRSVNIGLLGCGTVGANVLTLLERRRPLLESVGVRVNVAGVLVRDASRPRDVPPGTPLTADPAFLNECAVVIEAMGGIDGPLALLRPFLASGRSVITANKALLAERWDELRGYALAGELYYEASVMAGTPIIGPMSTVLRASEFRRLQAVLNGTCNYILTQMEGGRSYQEALAEAQALGYAEDPPTLDVGGFDTAHKLAVLARFCADGDFPYSAIRVRGIEQVTLDDVQDALRNGERIKLVAELRRTPGGWDASVEPRRLPGTHALCTSGASRNAMVFEGEECGELFFAGGGAGGMVTASAMMGDLLDYLIGFPGHVPLH